MKASFYIVFTIFLVGLTIGISVFTTRMMIGKSMVHASHMEQMEGMGVDTHRLAFMEHRDKIQDKLIHQGDYACCLETPCTTCIAKSPGHGEGASCACLADIMNGVHPCGECIGQILEGHGNKFLKDYFASAIAEKVGEEHLETIQKIIEEKYSTT